MSNNNLIITEQKIALVERWLKKADKYKDENDVENMMDKFFSLYVAYNAIYEKDKKDRDRAVNFIGQYLTDNDIASVIQSSLEYEKIIEKIKDGAFYIYGQSKDKSLLKKIKAEKDINKSVLDLIYGMRCNMFHGEKQIIAEQLDLLVPANKILEKLVLDLIQHIKDNKLRGA